MSQQIDNIVLRSATILFRNFEGREGPFNAAGDRNFSVLLDDDHAEYLAGIGWNIRQLKVREDGDTPQKYMTVSVKYRGRGGSLVRPPTIFMVSSRGKTAINEEFCEFLDQVDVRTSDLTIRPYEWVVNGKTGIKAYLKTLYLIIEEDPLDLEYQDVPELNPSGLSLAIEAGHTDSDVVEGEAWEIDENQKAIGR